MGPYVTSAVLGVMLSVLALSPVRAQSERSFALDLDRDLRGGKSLDGQCELLTDDTGTLELADVRKLPFQPAPPGIFSGNFTRATHWFRCDAYNSTQHSAPWVLEVAYTLLDHLTLHSPDAQGRYTASETGDRLPFAKREYEYHGFAFRVETPPGRHTYYLSVRTEGQLTVPMMAWDPDGFAVSLNQRAPLLWMFYGLLLAMLVYNLFILLSVRDFRYLLYVCYIGAYTLFQFTLDGLSFQYLWPDSPDWGNRFTPAALALALTTALSFGRYFCEFPLHYPRYDRIVGGAIYAGGLVILILSQIAPYRLTMLLAIGLLLASIGALFPLAVKLAIDGQRQARYFLVAWLIFVTGVTLYSLMALGVLPANMFTRFTIRIGAAIEVLLLSLGLADRINVMRRDLQQNVKHLTQALASAEAARRAKSVFLAGVSHELRTPLNAIINIPEGLMEDFPLVAAALCGQCGARFALEEGESIGLESTCPKCASGPLRTGEARAYHGDPAATHTHLAQVKHSGEHLLRVVSDILDVSKLEAGKMMVQVDRVSLGPLLEQVLAPMRALAQRQNIQLRLEVEDRPRWVRADPLKLEQVLLNLVSNAIKFCDGKGIVRIDVVDENDSCLIGVHDTGIGIGDEDKAIVFEAFVQARSTSNRRFGGTGLGLAISKMLVAAQGGEIWFESTLGEGTDFFVRIPRANDNDSPSSTPVRLTAMDREVGSDA